MFPAVGLQEAKDAPDAARKVLAQGLDPTEKRKGTKAALLLAHENSFQAIAEEWLARQTDKAEATRTKSIWLLGFANTDVDCRAIN